MKKKLVKLSAFAAIVLFLSNCENLQKSEEKNDIDLINEKNAKIEAARKDSINKLLDKIQVVLFNHPSLSFDADGFCMTNSKLPITEVTTPGDEFVCAKGNYIQKLTILGDFNGVDIVFFDNKNNVLHELENYNLDQSISFSSIDYQSDGVGSTLQRKDSHFQSWFDKATKVEVSYKDSLVTIQKWQNKGWFVQ
jgi:hypothetical protein